MLQLPRVSKVCKKSAAILTDATDQNNSLQTDVQSIAQCNDTGEHVFEICKSLSGQEHSFSLDTASRHALITKADLLNFYPNAKLQPTKEKVIGANLQPLQFLGMTTIPIIYGSGVAVHCDFLVQKRGFILLGVRAMRKLGITISFRKVKEEPKHPEPVPTSSFPIPACCDDPSVQKLSTHSSCSHSLCQEKTFSGNRNDSLEAS